MDKYFFNYNNLKHGKLILKIQLHVHTSRDTIKWQLKHNYMCMCWVGRALKFPPAKFVAASLDICLILDTPIPSSIWLNMLP